MLFEFTDSNFTETASKGVVFVVFYAAWAATYTTLAPTIEAVAKEYEDKVLFGRLDVDDNNLVSMRYGIKSIPVCIVLKDGNEVNRIVGATSKDALARMLEGPLAD